MLTSYLVQVMSQAPILIVAIVGIVLCRKRLARTHQLANAQAALGWVLLILFVLIGRGVSVISLNYVLQSGDRVGNAGWLTLAKTIEYALLVASLILLMRSTLADRGVSQSSNRAA